MQWSETLIPNSFLGVVLAAKQPLITYLDLPKAVHISWLCDGFCLTMSCQALRFDARWLHLIASWCFFFLRMLIHFSGGLPLGLVPCVLPSRAIFGNLSFPILMIWPRYLSRLLMMSSTVLLWPSVSLTFWFLILSSPETPRILRRQAISKTSTSSLFSSAFLRVQVSSP